MQLQLGGSETLDRVCCLQIGCWAAAHSFQGALCTLAALLCFTECLSKRLTCTSLKQAQWSVADTAVTGLGLHTKPHQTEFSKELCSDLFVILIHLEYTVVLNQVNLHILSLLVPKSINSV